MATPVTTTEPLRLSAWDVSRAPITPAWDFAALMEARCVSIGELATASGVSWTTIWRAAKGIGVPNTRTKRRLAAVLGVEPDVIRWHKRAA